MLPEQTGCRAGWAPRVPPTQVRPWFLRIAIAYIGACLRPAWSTGPRVTPLRWPGFTGDSASVSTVFFCSRAIAGLLGDYGKAWCRIHTRDRVISVSFEREWIRGKHYLAMCHEALKSINELSARRLYLKSNARHTVARSRRCCRRLLWRFWFISVVAVT